jgi:hypothetical protein
MRILVHFGKYNEQYWLVDTPARLDGAKRSLFCRLDEQGCYSRLEHTQSLKAAREGNISHINAILGIRNGIEGETWKIVSAMVVEDKSRRYAPFMAAAIHNLTKQYAQR